MGSGWPHEITTIRVRDIDASTRSWRCFLRIPVVAFDCNRIARRVWVRLTPESRIFIGMLILPFTPNSINVSMMHAEAGMYSTSRRLYRQEPYPQNSLCHLPTCVPGYTFAFKIQLSSNGTPPFPFLSIGWNLNSCQSASIYQHLQEEAESALLLQGISGPLIFWLDQSQYGILLSLFSTLPPPEAWRVSSWMYG